MLRLVLAIHRLASGMTSSGESLIHSLREIREGNQKLATQLDSKLMEFNNAITMDKQ